MSTAWYSAVARSLPFVARRRSSSAPRARGDLLGAERLDALGPLAGVVVVGSLLRRDAPRGAASSSGAEVSTALEPVSTNGSSAAFDSKLVTTAVRTSEMRPLLVDASEEHRGADARHLDEPAGGAPVERSDVLGADAAGGGARGASLSLGGDDDASADAVGVQQEGAGRRMGGVDDVDGGGGGGGARHVAEQISKRWAHTLWGGVLLTGPVSSGISVGC